MHREQHAGGAVPLLMITEVAAVLRVSKRPAYALVRSGQLPSVRIGRRGVRVLQTDLEHYVAAARDREGR